MEEPDLLFSLSKLLGPLLTPLSLFFWSALAVAVFGTVGRTRRALLALLAGLWLASAPLVSYTVLRWWERAYPPVALDAVPEADAIVVLGGMVVPWPAHGRPERVEFEGSVDRLLEGVRLLEAGKAPVLLLAGGTPDPRGRPEGPRLAAWLADAGVDPARILVETESRTTSENAAVAARIAQERGWKRLILVTSAAHMRRASLCFRKAGVDAVLQPADHTAQVLLLSPGALLPSEEALVTMRRLWRELLGLAAYRLAGRI